MRVDLLSRARIVSALEALSEELANSSRREEIVIVGGAALVLLFGARAATKDVDAVVLGDGRAAVVREAASRVASRLDLPEDWLNDAAKGFVHALALGDTLFESPSLLARAAAPQQLLAMKLSAWRDDIDIEDARLLLRTMGQQRDDIWALVEPHLGPGRELKARLAFEDLWESEHGPA